MCAHELKQRSEACLQEVVDGGDGVQHDGEKKGIQSEAGQQEGPFGKNRFPFRDEAKKGQTLKTDRRKSREGLTVLVAGLSERFPFGENDGNSQILKRRHVEETGVLVVLDVFGAVGTGCVLAVKETGAGHVTGTAGQREVIRVNPALHDATLWCRCRMQAFSVRGGTHSE